MDMRHKTVCVCAWHFVLMEMELISSGHGIMAGRASSAFTVQIKTAEITATIENRFSPRCLNDTVNSANTHTHKQLHTRTYNTNDLPA